jgi:hypothetical protein
MREDVVGHLTKAEHKIECTALGLKVECVEGLKDLKSECRLRIVKSTGEKLPTKQLSYFVADSVAPAKLDLSSVYTVRMNHIEYSGGRTGGLRAAFAVVT